MNKKEAIAKMCRRVAVIQKDHRVAFGYPWMTYEHIVETRTRVSLSLPYF